MTPYAEALTWIRQHPFTGGSRSLSKLILSLYGGDACGFSYRECVDSLDSNLSALAVRVIQHFHRVGEDQELVEIGREIADTYPRLLEIGETQLRARRTQEERWAREDAIAERDEQEADDGPAPA